MHSLYHSLLSQHPKQLTPILCATSTLNQLQRYFEDVVLENDLNALVVERLPRVPVRSATDVARFRTLAKHARELFLILRSEDGLTTAPRKEKPRLQSIVWESAVETGVCERFVIIADANFSALLMSIKAEESDEHETSEVAIWTFEPDIVYSALEYLMARIHAEQPQQSAAFSEAVKKSMPKETSLNISLSVTTKFVQLLQEQAKREVAINRVVAAMSRAASLETVVAIATREIGRTLDVMSCAVRLEDAGSGMPMTQYYFRPDGSGDPATRNRLLSDLTAYSSRMVDVLEPEVVDHDASTDESGLSHIAVPVRFNNVFLGLLLVRDDSATRVWSETDRLLLQTAANHLAIAGNQAMMLRDMQEQAMTDPLTGCFNRRSFELQLERDLHLATRMRQPLSLVMMDVDNFQAINDSVGREAGNRALRVLAETLRAELRAVDTASRFESDEFVVILPQANSEGARVVAERLRATIAQTDIPGFGTVTASFGIASFPLNASSRDTLVVAANRALCLAKEAGRNKVSSPPEDPDEEQLDEIPDARHLMESFTRR